MGSNLTLEVHFSKKSIILLLIIFFFCCFIPIYSLYFVFSDLYDILVFPNCLYIIYLFIFLCIRRPQCHLCSDPNLELQLVPDALSPQVECLQSTDKDPELSIFACLVLWEGVAFSASLPFLRTCFPVMPFVCLSPWKGKWFCCPPMKKWESSWNMCASVYMCKCT